MKKDKLTIVLMFGGKSPEHEVSVWSARNIYSAMDKSKFEVLLVGVDKTGKWSMIREEEFLSSDFKEVIPGAYLSLAPGFMQPFVLSGEGVSLPRPDAVFPIIHGPNGEDGTLQGLLQQLDLPYVGPNTLGSSVAMDKDICKRLFLEAGLLTANCMVFHRHEMDSIDYAAVINRLGSPLFIKPANMGSSVGVSKANNEEEFHQAVSLAFQFDTKILVEEMITGREIECAVLGNEFPETTGLGEIIVTKGFYDYDTKYITDDAKIVIPAENVSESALEKIKIVARQAFQVLGCEGLSRVDVFLTKDENVYINEINTLPGFTSISMYPKLWEKAGIPYDVLIEKLISLAMTRHQRDNRLNRSKG